MANLHLKFAIPVFVTIIGIVAYWRLVNANPTAIQNHQIAYKLSENAATNSNEEKSREEDLAERTSGDHSHESHEQNDTDKSGEVKIFSAKIVQNESGNGTIAVANVQSWEKDTAPINVTADETVIYFLDEDGEVDMAGSNVTELRIVAGNLPCNNQKNQFFRELDRCNGIYQCDDNGEDERNCPSKCLNFRYQYASDLVDCKAYIPRFFYDYETEKCQFFVYGGCADVANMFLSKTECERECRGISLTTKPENVTMAPSKVEELTTKPVEIVTSTETTPILTVMEESNSTVETTTEATITAPPVAPAGVKLFGETAASKPAPIIDVIEETEAVTTTEAGMMASGNINTDQQAASPLIAAAPVGA